jgi:hypothetical protein
MARSVKMLKPEKQNPKIFRLMQCPPSMDFSQENLTGEQAKQDVSRKTMPPNWSSELVQHLIHGQRFDTRESERLTPVSPSKAQAARRYGFSTKNRRY